MANHFPSGIGKRQWQTNPKMTRKQHGLAEAITRCQEWLKCKKTNNARNACWRQHPQKENLDMFKYMIASFIYVHIWSCTLIIDQKDWSNNVKM